MDIKEIQKRALQIRKMYANFEKQKIGKEWTNEQIVQGFVGDVGDLVKLIMAKEGLRDIEDADNKLAHELSDCFYAIMVIAKKYNIDIEKSFLKKMEEIEINISKK